MEKAAPPPPAPYQRFEALDLLRLFAVTAVILFHYGFRGAMGDDHLTRVWLPSCASVAIYGYLGVKLFFVISGFVISFSAEGRNATQFAIARASRIYPAFLFCMSVTFLVTLALGGTVFHTSFGQWLANATIILPAKSLQLAMDGAYWSIYVELIFYAWIAVLIGTGLFAKNLTLTVFLWLVLSAANQLAMHSILIEKLFLTSQSGFLAAGILLFILLARGKSLFALLTLGLATALAVVQALEEAAYFIDFIHAPLNSFAVVALSIGSIGLVAMAAGIRPTRPPSRVVLALGGLTYALYLLHQNIGYMLFNRLSGLLPAEALVPLVMLLMFVASFLTWRFIDRPGQRLMRKALLRLTGACSAKVCAVLR